jgi:AbrB family looped-hinge helix DNA binding protein
MDEPATVTSKGQVTIPAAVRRALQIQPGTRVVFRVEPGGVSLENPAAGKRAVVQTYPDLLELAGTVPVPPDLKAADWGEIRARTRASRGARRQARR